MTQVQTFHKFVRIAFHWISTIAKFPIPCATRILSVALILLIPVGASPYPLLFFLLLLLMLDISRWTVGRSTSDKVFKLPSISDGFGGQEDRHRTRILNMIIINANKIHLFVCILGSSLHARLCAATCNNTDDVICISCLRNCRHKYFSPVATNSIGNFNLAKVETDRLTGCVPISGIYGILYHVLLHSIYAVCDCEAVKLSHVTLALIAENAEEVAVLAKLINV